MKTETFPDTLGHTVAFKFAKFESSQIYIMWGILQFFSAWALPIGVNFCMAVRSQLRQVFSHFGGIAPGMAEFWASTGAIWWDMLLAEAFVFFLYKIQFQSNKVYYKVSSCENLQQHSCSITIPPSNGP